MQIGTLPPGARGFDCNRPVTRAVAAAAVQKGYSFAVRYVRRAQAHDYDISAAEILAILGGGLGLMLVQHVAPEGWTPTPALGAEYGTTAAKECRRVGLPSGVSVWCDLEGVARGVPPAEVIGFCNRWHAAVAEAGFRPGLYVGYGAGLSAEQLYRSLRFDGYWGAYNLNREDIPAVRGLQMRQLVARKDEWLPGFDSATMDVDILQTDAKGGTPSVLLPDGWPVVA
jgi:hypothetical protein